MKLGLVENMKGYYIESWLVAKRHDLIVIVAKVVNKIQNAAKCLLGVWHTPTHPRGSCKPLRIRNWVTKG